MTLKRISLVKRTLDVLEKYFSVKLDYESTYDPRLA